MKTRKTICVFCLFATIGLSNIDASVKSVQVQENTITCCKFSYLYGF